MLCPPHNHSRFMAVPSTTIPAAGRHTALFVQTPHQGPLRSAVRPGVPLQGIDAFPNHLQLPPHTATGVPHRWDDTVSSPNPRTANRPVTRGMARTGILRHASLTAFHPPPIPTGSLHNAHTLQPCTATLPASATAAPTATTTGGNHAHEGTRKCHGRA